MKTILIVEDDHFLADAYKIAFDEKKYTVIQAFDGESAIKAVREHHPTVVILDLILPVKDGFSVLEAVRADKSFDDVSIVIASNLGQQSELDRGKKLGANDYIVKSQISIADLIAKVESFL